MKHNFDLLGMTMRRTEVTRLGREEGYGVIMISLIHFHLHRARVGEEMAVRKLRIPPPFAWSGYQILKNNYGVHHLITILTSSPATSPSAPPHPFFFSTVHFNLVSSVRYRLIAISSLSTASSLSKSWKNE
jgi:hypothetical protein